MESVVLIWCLFCSLFNNVISNSNYIGKNDWIVVNNKLERTRNERIVT
jgi:hypothetical protein